MNGKAAKKLRKAFGTGTTYRKAKKAYDTYPTRFAQGTLTVPKRASESTVRSEA